MRRRGKYPSAGKRKRPIRFIEAAEGKKKRGVEVEGMFLELIREEHILLIYLPPALSCLIHFPRQTNAPCQVLCGLVCCYFTACLIVTQMAVDIMGVFQGGRRMRWGK